MHPKKKYSNINARSALALAVIGAAAALSGNAAVAGEITLYETAGFGGRLVTLRATAPSVNNIGFNDRTSSIVVRSGRWEVCSDDDFKGDCAIFEPGQYASLDGRFDKRVSSAREVQTVGAAPAPVAATALGAIDVYGQPNFRGRSAHVDRDARNFNAFNFNDRASSVVVSGSAWEMCTDADFGGTCRTFAPGRYATLGYGMGNAISSARPVVVQAPPPVVHGGGWNHGQRNERDNAAAVVLFSNDAVRGRSIALASDNPDLSKSNFNDAAQSLVIENGYWEFCSDSYYRGQCRVMGPGQYARLEPALYRSISSVRAAAAQTDGRGGERRGDRDNRNERDRGERGAVELFTGENFAGTRYPVSADMTTFDQGGFNDRIGSVVVNSGQWQMCVDANYRGNCTVFGPGRYPGLGGLTNQLSSIRRIE
jgi:hypothetical protein